MQNACSCDALKEEQYENCFACHIFKGLAMIFAAHRDSSLSEAQKYAYESKYITKSLSNFQNFQDKGLFGKHS